MHKVARVLRRKSLPSKPAGPQRRSRVTLISLGGTAKSKKSFSIEQLLGNDPEGRQDSEVEVSGFVQSIRKQSKVAFAAIKDGSGLDTLQAVLKPHDAQSLSPGAAVVLQGRFVACRPGAQQSHELQVTSARLAGENDADSNPIQNKYQTSQYLRTLPHLRLRTPANACLLRLRSTMSHGFSRFFQGSGFCQVHTPVITSSDCEGAGEVFSVASGGKHSSADDAQDGQEAFFRSQKYLTVSAQLHLEAVALAVDRVWTLSPTFRAEKSDTSRHLSEFYMLEVEMAFEDSLDPIMDILEESLREVSRHCLENRQAGREALLRRIKSQGAGDDTHAIEVDSTQLEKRWAGLQRRFWPRITYSQAFDILEADKRMKFALMPDRTSGLQAEHERYLAEKVGQGSPIFVTDYPREQKPFYMLPTPDGDGRTVACFDLLAPDVGEIAGGSLREYRLEPLREAMRSKGLLGTPSVSNGDADEPSKLDWYLDLRRYGSAPHGGYGLGFDRFLCYLAGVSNIRDMVTFPRWHGRCDT